MEALNVPRLIREVLEENPKKTHAEKVRSREQEVALNILLDRQSTLNPLHVSVPQKALFRSSP